MSFTIYWYDIHTNEFGASSIYNKKRMKQMWKTVIFWCYSGGNDNNSIFIENGKYHGGIIAQKYFKKKQTPLES